MTSPLHGNDLRAVFGDIAAEFRKTALPLHDGEVAAADLVAAMDPGLRRLGIPPEFNDAPLKSGSEPILMRRISDSVVIQEELAWGDAGLVLAMPWSSMSVFLVEMMYEAEERERHYRIMADEPVWTFFAVTEPEHGSDPVAMDTTLSQTEGGFVLNGVKRYIGNGTRSFAGFVFCRREGTSGPMGLEAVRVSADAEGFEAEPLQTLGLRGAGLSELRFRDVRVREEDLVGRKSSSTRRGLFGAANTFDIFRPGVGSMALGVARAAYDYARSERRTLRASEQRDMELFGQRILATRALIAAAARAIDSGKASGALSSAAKRTAVRLADDVTRAAITMLGPGARLDHPLLDKLRRDAQGFEFMEGMTDIQRQNAAQGYLTNRFWPSQDGVAL